MRVNRVSTNAHNYKHKPVNPPQFKIILPKKKSMDKKAKDKKKIEIYNSLREHSESNLPKNMIAFISTKKNLLSPKVVFPKITSIFDNLRYINSIDKDFRVTFKTQVAEQKRLLLDSLKSYFASQPMNTKFQKQALDIYHSSIKKFNKKKRTYERSFTPFCTHPECYQKNIHETISHLYRDCPRAQPAIDQFISVTTKQIQKKMKNPNFTFSYPWDLSNSQQPNYSSKDLTYWLMLGYRPAHIDNLKTEHEQSNSFPKASDNAFEYHLILNLHHTRLLIEALKRRDDSLLFQTNAQIP